PKLVAYRTDVRSNLHSIANDSRWIDRAQILITCIVGVQHHDARPRSGQALEKFSLCTKIRFHVSVKIQMIPAEISECRNIEVKSCARFHSDCMRRNFHDCVKATGINHLSEQLLQIRCFRCGPFGHEMESWTTVFNGSENRRRFACSVQDRVHNVSCRCLAVGARHTNQMQVFRRVPIKISRDCGHSRALIHNLNPRQRDCLYGIQCRDDCNSPFGDGPWHEPVAVLLRTANSKEEITGRHAPGIVSETKNICVEVATDTTGLEAGNQVVQCHKSEGSEAGVSEPPGWGGCSPRR